MRFGSGWPLNAGELRCDNLAEDQLCKWEGEQNVALSICHLRPPGKRHGPAAAQLLSDQCPRTLRGLIARRCKVRELAPIGINEPFLIGDDVNEIAHPDPGTET